MAMIRLESDRNPEKNREKKSYCCNTNRGFPLGAFLEMNPFVPVTDSKDSVSAEIKIKY